MTTRWTLRSTTFALVVAVLVVASAGSISVAAHDAPASDSNVTGVSVATTGPSCFGSEALQPGGLLQTSPAGDRAMVTLNATVAHDQDVRPTVRLVERGDGEYAVVVRTSDHRSGTGDGSGPATTDRSCRTGTHVVLTAAIPADYDRVTVEVGGEAVGTVESDGLLPSVTSLPSPVEI